MTRFCLRSLQQLLFIIICIEIPEPNIRPKIDVKRKFCCADKEMFN